MRIWTTCEHITLHDFIKISIKNSMSSILLIFQLLFTEFFSLKLNYVQYSRVLNLNNSTFCISCHWCLWHRSVLVIFITVIYRLRYLFSYYSLKSEKSTFWVIQVTYCNWSSFVVVRLYGISWAGPNMNMKKRQNFQKSSSLKNECMVIVSLRTSNQNCEIHGPWVRGSDPRVVPILWKCYFNLKKSFFPLPQ